MEMYVYLIPVAGVLALIFAFVRSSWIVKQDAGTDEMKVIAGHIREGAMAFLGREYRVLAVFVVVVAVLLALAFHQFAVIGMLARMLAGVRPGVFFRKARTLMVTAFSTSSSNATLPTTIRTAQEGFGVPREVAGFVLPLGATMNMNGTALFEGMTVLFLAQVFGVELSLAMQGVVVLMVVLTAIGTAGVPGGSIPLLVLVLEMVGVPGEGIALVLGVDRILDMSRTVPNVTGDLLTSLVVTRSERLPFVVPEPEPVTPAGREAALAG